MYTLNTESSKSNLTNEQKDTLQQLLNTHRALFALDMTKIGKCKIPAHPIATFDVPVVRQRFYHQPPHLQRKTDRQVEESLINDVIVRSNS